MVPLTFSLLKLLFDRFLVSFHALVLFYEAVDRNFDLFDIVERHVRRAPKNFMYEFSFNVTSCQAACVSSGMLESPDKLKR
jgi:hypothetical protein